MQTPREAMIMMSAICERLEANPEKGDPSMTNTLQELVM